MSLPVPDPRRRLPPTVVSSPSSCVQSSNIGRKSLRGREDSSFSLFSSLLRVSLSLSHSLSLPIFQFEFRLSNVRPSVSVSTFHCDVAGGRCKFALSALSVYVSVCQLVRSSVLLSLSDQMQMPTVTDTYRAWRAGRRYESMRRETAFFNTVKQIQQCCVPHI